jgi:hypothetical protein
MDFLVDIHSWYRWVVLVVLLAVGVGGLLRSRQGAQWSSDAERPFTLATILFDLQLAIGIVLWIGDKGWDQDFFIKVIHPVGMLLAAGIAHMALVRARKGHEQRAYATAGAGVLVALVAVAAVIPRSAWF